MPSNAKKKNALFFDDGTANRAAELLPAEVRQRCAVRGIRRQPLEPLEVEQAARSTGSCPTW